MFFSRLPPEKPTTLSPGLAGIVNKVYLAEWKTVIYSIGTKNNDFRKMNCFFLIYATFRGRGGGGGTPYGGLYGEAP